MIASLCRKSMVLLNCGALLMILVVPAPAFASRTITCESRDHRYRYCRVDTDNQVTLRRQVSESSCRRGGSWGYDRHGVWVDRGCGAEFEVGKRDSSSHAGAAVAAIAGLAIVAAIASNKDRDDEVASWAVGSFDGWDERERTNVSLTVLPGGHVSGWAGQQRFEGSLHGHRLTAGRKTFRVERSGNGFQATNESDGGYRVMFRRTGGGY